MSNQEAKTEKRSAALSSVIYAVFLTTFKLIVGLLTNSLGILAEAAHSGLDLVAAAATYFAVRASDKPAEYMFSVRTVLWWSSNQRRRSFAEAL